MTKPEIAKLISMIERHWHTFEAIPEEAYGSYLYELKDVAFVHGVAAVDAIARGGSRFMPLAGEIKRKVVELELDPPSWPDVIEQVVAHRRFLRENPLPEKCLLGNDDCVDGFVIHPSERVGQADMATPCVCQEQRREHHRGNLHPLVRSFVRQFSYAMDMVLEGDTTADSQTRRKWDEHVASALDERVLAGINAPGLRKIERANSGSAGEIERSRAAIPQRT
jgi:hypothetical protein